MRKINKEIIIDGIAYRLVPIKEEQVFSDWRLPTIQELKTLVNYNKRNPACDLEDTESDGYWSSSQDVSSSNYIWYVGFYHGCDSFIIKSSRLLVRCVRDGENGLEWSRTSEKKMTYDEANKYASGLVATVYFK